MAFVLSEPLFIFLLLFACFAQHSKVFAILESYDGYIANNLPDNSQALKIHIFSGDDDLGFHNLKVNEFFTWQFQMNFFGNTKFYGHFWWGNKERGFAVFDKHLAPKCGDHDVNACWWSVREDGFYLARVKTNPVEYVKMNWWLNKTTM